MDNERIDELTDDDSHADTSYKADQRLRDSWGFLLSSRKGRVVLRDLLLLTKFGKSALGHDTNATMANAGLQVCGEYIIDMITECYPEAYGLMLKEAKEDAEYDRDTDNTSSSSNSSIGTSRSHSGHYTG